MAGHRQKRQNRDKRRKKAKPFRSFGKISKERIKPKPSGITVPIDPMGLGGQKQELVSVPVRLIEGQRVSGTPAGSQGTYTATIWLRKPDIPLRGEGDFRFDSNVGDSHVILGAQTELHIDVTYNDGHQHAQLICLPNDRGALAAVRTRVEAPNFSEAQHHAVRIVSPTLSLWSTLLDIPIAIDRVELIEEQVGTSHMTILNPFLDASIRDVATDGGSATETLRIFASYYREAMGSNSDPYQLLCLFKIIEGIRALRVRRQREATRRGRAIAAVVAPETIPNDSVEFVPWLERIYPVRTSPWDEMAVGSVFIPEARGRTIAALVEPGDRELQRPPGPLCALRNQIAHSIGPGSQPLIADEALHSQQVLHWLPITKCVVRLLLANEFPDELWTPASRREVLSRLAGVYCERASKCCKYM